MTPTRKRRLLTVAGIVLGVGTAVTIALVALQDAVRFALTPSEALAMEHPEGRNFRLGGLVADGSVRRDPESLAVTFLVTDGRAELPVSYIGILPDLFREGQGVIAHGTLDASGHFHAHEVLARHDETYMPPEAARALEAAARADGAYSNE